MMKHFFAIFLFVCVASLPSCDLYSGLMGDEDTDRELSITSNRITDSSGDSSCPSLAWAGSGYGVCWHDDRNVHYDIYFARISASGAKIGSDVRITTDAGNSYYPSLVWTGSEYGVVWQDNRNGNSEIFFTRISATGIKIGSDVLISEALGNSEYPSLIWTGSGYGVCWADDRDGNREIYFARISASGVKLGSDVRITNAVGASENSSLVWTGSEYGVVWNDDRDVNREIYFARISALGVKIGSDVRITNNTGDSVHPSLSRATGGYGVSWHDDRDGNINIYFARIDASGVKIGSDVGITTDAGNSVYPSLTWTGSEYGVTWVDTRDGHEEIYFARTNTTGVKQDGDIRITTNAVVSTGPVLVWTGNAFGACWQDNRNGNWNIYFARIVP